MSPWPVTRSLFQSLDLTAMESELITFLASWTPPKLGVSKYDAFISVLASAGATPTFLLLVISVLATHDNIGWFHLQMEIK